MSSKRLEKHVYKFITVLSAGAVIFAVSMHFISAPGTYSHFISQARSENNTFMMGIWSTTEASLSYTVPVTTEPGVAFELDDITGTSIEIGNGTTGTGIAAE